MPKARFTEGKKDERHLASLAKKARTLHLIGLGQSVYEAIADPMVGVSYSAYRKWRERDPSWAAEVDCARQVYEGLPSDLTDMTSAQFALRYFGHVRAPFQQRWINSIEKIRPGNILMALWPPDHGKTATFEDYATETLARDQQFRFTVAGESSALAKRVLGQIRGRLEPDGPCPMLVDEWGPFRPEAGRSKSHIHQPWNNSQFNVLQKRLSFDRDHNMLALGWDSKILSIRTDQLHIDDPQSTKTLSRTDKILEWFRQDALSRPGETGITTINGSRVGDNDFYSKLEEDDELDGILEVIKIKAIVTDQTTGEKVPAWPEKFSMEGLDRIRRKVKDAAFDRNYMMEPGLSNVNRTFTDEGKARALNPARRLNSIEGFDGKPTLVLSLDPGLNPGKTNLQGYACQPDMMQLVYFKERDDLNRNEEIFAEIRTACQLLRHKFRIAHLTIEAVNFQRGLARDDRLIALSIEFGFTMGEHVTNVNKYDEAIGLASMAGDWQAGKIELPYFDDEYTREWVDEICRQLRNWKPGQRGNKYRIDALMAMWFAWIWWSESRADLDKKQQTWKRQGLPYAPTQSGLIIPIGAKL